MRRPSIDQSRIDRLHTGAFKGAKGGKQHMFSEQAAGPARGGRSGKVETPAPGARAARGGKVESTLRSAKPASAGRTSPR
jgi:hypothetical protein